MINVRIQTGQTKEYLRHFTHFDFNSSVEFLMALFFANPAEQSPIEEEIFSLIAVLGFDHIHDIPEDILSDLESIYHQRISEANLSADKEQQAYQLLALLKDQTLVLMIDDKVVKDLMAPVHLQPDAIITFFDASKGQDISFTTL